MEQDHEWVEDVEGTGILGAMGSELSAKDDDAMLSLVIPKYSDPLERACKLYRRRLSNQNIKIELHKLSDEPSVKPQTGMFYYLGSGIWEEAAGRRHLRHL